MSQLVEKIFAQRIHPILSSLFAQVAAPAPPPLGPDELHQIGAVSGPLVLVLVLCHSYKACVAFANDLVPFRTADVSTGGQHVQGARLELFFCFLQIFSHVLDEIFFVNRSCPNV